MIAARMPEGKENLDKLSLANSRLERLGQPTIPVPTNDGHPAEKAVQSTDIREVNALLDEFHAYCDKLKEAALEADKRVKKAMTAAAASMADSLLSEQLTGGNVVIAAEGGNDLLTELFNGLRKRHYEAAAILVADDGSTLSLGAYCGSTAQAAGLKAGELIRTLAPIVGGKGGGKNDMARGSGRDLAGKSELLTKAAELLS